jgi:lysozyme
LARRKRRFKKWRVLLAVIICLALLTWGALYSIEWLQLRKARFVRYKEFGIAIPEQYSIHGIDVSRYQQMIAWDAVKEMKVENISIQFAFIKATEGIGNVDAQFHRNWKKAKQQGITRGAYHFFIASKDGMSQAKNFIDEVKLEPGDLPPVLDIEQLNGTAVTTLKKEVKEWLDAIELYYGVKPIIYTNVEFYRQYLGSEFDRYLLWAAHYYEYKQPRIQRGWSFWQHSDEGKVNGILSKVDFNVFNGDSTTFLELLVD